MTNAIQDAIEKNNVIFSEKWEATHDRINRHSEELHLLKNRVVDLEALSGLQQTALQSCQNTIAGLEETVTNLTVSVTTLEKLVCCCPHGSAKKMPTELVKTLSQNASIVGRYIGEHRVFTPIILVIL